MYLCCPMCTCDKTDGKLLNWYRVRHTGKLSSAVTTLGSVDMVLGYLGLSSIAHELLAVNSCQPNAPHNTEET